MSLTIQYDPWIHKITRRMYNKFQKYYAYEDLLSVARIASLEAERTYDPERAKFSAYIKPRIEGAVIRAVSNITNTQHTALLKMHRFIDDYVAKHDRVPAQHIILSHLGLTEAEFIKLLDVVTKVTYISIDDVADGDVAVDFDMDTYAEFDKVLEVVEGLPWKQRALVTEFLEDPTCSEAKLKDVLVTIREKLHIKVGE